MLASDVMKAYGFASRPAGADPAKRSKEPPANRVRTEEDDRKAAELMDMIIESGQL